MTIGVEEVEDELVGDDRLGVRSFRLGFDGTPPEYHHMICSHKNHKESPNSVSYFCWKLPSSH